METLIPLALSAAAAVFYAAISVFRHDHFGSNAFDLGVQDQTVWGYSQFQVIFNTVEGIRNLMGDHFHPILMAIAPLYWIWNDVRVLLIVQAVLLAAASIPIAWWAREQLGFWAAAAFQLAYLIFWGILAGVVYDFHHIAFAVPAVAFAIYAILTRRTALFWVMLVVGFLTRENVTLTFLFMGLYLVVVQRRWQLGAAVMALSLGWFFLLIRVVMPALAGQPYSHWTYDALGTGPVSAVLHVLRHPVSSIRLLFTPFQKTRIWGALLAPWLLLPVLSPIFMIAFPSLADRFWSSNSLLWTTHFHYSLLISPILAFAAIDTLARAQRWWPVLRAPVPAVAIPAGVLAAGVVFSFVLTHPLDELGAYVSSRRAAQIQACLDVIPKGASVSAANYLLPHLSHRSQIYLLTTRPDADVIAFDLSTYQHFYPGEDALVRKDIVNALNGDYGVACTNGGMVVLQRGLTGKTLSAELQRFVAGQ